MSTNFTAMSSEHRCKIDVANQIKQLCKKNMNGFWEEINPSKTWSVFVELSECIGRENENSEPIEFFRSFVHQAVLLNAALIRVKDDDKKIPIKHKINDLANQIVSNLASENGTEPQHRDITEVSKAMKIHLIDMRERAAASVKNIPNCSNKLSEESKIEIIENIMEETTKNYGNLMRNISDSCTKMLGDPPCQFVHLAMGSFSRGAVTPYSDFENGIVFEDTKQENKLKNRQLYFRSYAVLFEMIVIGLSEAPIRLAGIECLNDFSFPASREKDWFWDAFTPSGIQFDSHLPFSNKPPPTRLTAEQNIPSIELVGTKSEILDYIKQNRALKEGYHLAEMLGSTSFVSGSMEFFNQYASDATSEMSKIFQSAESFDVMIHDYEQSLRRFSIQKDIEKLGSTLNVKNSLYRLFFVFLTYLERLTDVQKSKNYSSRNTVKQWLESHVGINEESAHNLLYALALVNEIRMKLYLKRKEKSDIVAGTKYVLDSETSANVFSLLSRDDVVNVFAIGLSWNTALLEILPKLTDQSNILNTKKIVFSILNQRLKQRKSFYQQGLILRHFEEYENAIEAFRKCLNGSSEDMFLIKVYNDIGQSHFGALQFSKACNAFETSLSIIQSLPESTKQLHLLAEVHDWIGQGYTEIQPRDEPWSYEVATKNLNESMNKWKRLQSQFPDNPVYTKGLADVLDSKGWMYFRKKDFEKSLTSYLEAAKLFEKLSVTNLDIKNEIVKVENGIALCYHELKRYKKLMWAASF